MHPSNPSPLALNKPTVPAAVANGGLRWQDLRDPGSPVQVQIVLVPGTVQLNHRIDLYWENLFVTTEIVRQEHLETGVVSLSVSSQVILSFRDGYQTFYYIATAPVGGGTEQSPDGEVRVKRLVPGDPDPDNTTPNVNENLEPPLGVPPSIETATELVVTVRPWRYMAEGDVLTLYWGGTQQALRKPPLTPGQVNQPQTVTVAAQTIIDAGDGANLQVNYDIRDQVNNWSLYSLPAFTNVQVDPNAPGAPRVVDADANLEIDLDRLGNRDVRVDAPAYSGIALNDSVTLKWEGQTADGNPVVPVLPAERVDNVGFGPTFNVPNKPVVDIAGGAARVYYDVSPAAGGPLRRSRSVSVTVSGQPVALAAPVVDEATGTVIDLETIVGTSVTVRIAVYVAQAVGDKVVLNWRGTTEQNVPVIYTDEHVIQTGEETRPTLFVVARTHLDPLINGRLDLSYQVIFNATGNSKNSPTANYTVEGAGVGPVEGDESFEAQALRQLPVGVRLPFANGLFITVTTGATGTTIVNPYINEFGSRALYCAGGNKIKFEFGGEIRLLLLSHALTASTNNRLEFFNKEGQSVRVVNLKQIPITETVALEIINLPSVSVFCELTVDSIGTMVDNFIWES